MLEAMVVVFILLWLYILNCSLTLQTRPLLHRSDGSLKWLRFYGLD